MELELEIQKTNVEIRISIVEIPWVPIFRQNRHFLLFRPKFAQKLILESEFQKLSPNSESAAPRFHVFKFSVKTDNFEFFGLNLGKWLSCMRYFSFNNTEMSDRCKEMGGGLN